MTANRSLSIIPTVQFWLIKLLRQCTYRISGFDPEAPYSVDDPPFCQEINQIALDNAIEALGRFPLSCWSVKPFKLSWNIDFGSLWNSWNPIWNGRRQSCHRWAKLARIRSQIWTGYEWRPDRQSSQSISRFPWIFSSTDAWLWSYIDTTPMIWIYYPLCRAKNGPEKTENKISTVETLSSLPHLAVNFLKEKIMVQARSLKTPADFPQIPGVPDPACYHYCHLLSPARIMEWIYTDSLRENLGYWINISFICTV